MAAATRYLVKGSNKIEINVTGVFSAADETDTVVVDISTLVGPKGVAPTAVRIDEVTWSISPGFDYVLLEWDHTTDDPVDYFSGQGYISYKERSGGKNDPRSAGATGDLILSTVGGAAGDAYSFLISATLKE